MSKNIFRFSALLLIFLLLSSSVSFAAPEEPSSAGDGLMPYDDVLRLIQWIDLDYAKNLHYEDVVAFTGVEGFDCGNTGPNSITDLGDHYFNWIAQEDPTHYIHVCFRGRETGFELCQWNTSGFYSSEWEGIDLTDWLITTACNEYTGVSGTIQRFDYPAIEVRANIPVSKWESRSFGSNELQFVNALGGTYDPRIQIQVFDTPDMFDFYIDSYENLQSTDSRTICGIEMQGRTYHYMGEDWHEYLAVLEDDVAIGIQIMDTLSVAPGTEGAAVLESLSLHYTSTDGTVKDLGVTPDVSSAAPAPSSEPTPTEMPAEEPTPAPTEVPSEESASSTAEMSDTGHTSAVSSFLSTLASTLSSLTSEGNTEPTNIIAENIDEAMIGAWHCIYVHTAALDFDPREMSLDINLVLREDGTSSFDYPDPEESFWGVDESGVLRHTGTGHPLSLQEDGTLVMGSYESGYMLFSTDKAYTASIFPQPMLPDSIDTPAAMSVMPETETDVPVAEAAFDFDTLYSAITFTTGGISMDASSMGTYTILFHPDGTCNYTMAGVNIPDLTWKATEDGAEVDYFGTPLCFSVTEEGLVMDFFGSGTLLFAAETK